MERRAGCAFLTAEARALCSPARGNERQLWAMGVVAVGEGEKMERKRRKGKKNIKPLKKRIGFFYIYK